jgi:adenine-specific DNA-methyltransferase
LLPGNVATPPAGTTRIKRPTPSAGDTADAEPLVRGQEPAWTYAKPHGELFRRGRIDLEPCGDEPRFGGPIQPLGELGRIRQGIAENPASVTAKANREHGGRWRTGEGVFCLRREEVQRLGLSDAERRLLRPYHDLCDLGRYRMAAVPSLTLLYSTRRTCPEIGAFPAVRRHLERFRPLLEARRETRQGTRPWWQLHWPREEEIWERSKLLVVQMARRPAIVPALAAAYVPFSVNVFVPHDGAAEHLYYFAAVLNSRLAWRWFERHAKRRGVGLEINGGVLAAFPMRRIDIARPGEQAHHDRLVELVAAMLAAGEADREEFDAEIDRIVQRLYAGDLAS